MVDDATFTARAEALLGALHRIAMSILHSEADVQDAVQQALVRAWAARATVRPEHFRPWLTRIVINECRNIQRYRMRVSPVYEIHAARAFEPPDPDVTLAIEGLPQKLRVPFLLKYACSYTEREIAQALGLTVPGVKSRLLRARRTLREQLSDKEVTFS